MEGVVVEVPPSLEVEVVGEARLPSLEEVVEEEVQGQKGVVAEAAAAFELLQVAAAH